MKCVKMLGLGLMVAVMLATGCDEKKPDGGTPKGKKGGDHAHGKGPNDGVVFDLGKYHAEFTVNHDKKECKVVILEGEDKNAKLFPVTAKELTVTTKETKTKEGKVVPPMTIKLTPTDAKEGKAATFTGTDPGLGNVADFEGTVTGEIEGKPSSGDFKE